MNYLMNRLANCKNEYQGKTKKVLCICSAGLLRSPTAAVVLASEPFNYNTRAAGLTPEFALVPIDEVLIKWADEFVCMELKQAEAIADILDKGDDRPVYCLNIPDNFAYRDPDLIGLIRKQYKQCAEIENNDASLK